MHAGHNATGRASRMYYGAEHNQNTTALLGHACSLRRANGPLQQLVLLTQHLQRRVTALCAGCNVPRRPACRTGRGGSGGSGGRADRRAGR